MSFANFTREISAESIKWKANLKWLKNEIAFEKFSTWAGCP
jgi:hypothetical protein